MEDTDLSGIETLDDFFKETQPIGSQNKAISNNLFGINHRKIKGQVPDSKDMYGYTFMTRPQLNLTTANIRNVRTMYPLLTTNDLSVDRYVRMMLDPRLKNPPITSDMTKVGTGIDCPFLDNDMAFIPIVTNNIKSMSGWPDVVVPTFTSKEGMRKEQISMVDGTTDLFQAFDLDLTFRNTREEPIANLFRVWTHYMADVFEGTLSPYLDYITENEFDYNTRIYRLVMSEDQRFVKKIAAIGAGFPLNDPTGKYFDYSDEKPYSEQTKDITIRFRAIGAIYNDAILIKSFNRTVGIFNPEMRKVIKGDKNDMQKIPRELMVRLNHRGYPLINERTYELEWWIHNKHLSKGTNNGTN